MMTEFMIQTGLVVTVKKF